MDASWRQVECDYKRHKTSDPKVLRDWDISSIPTTIVYDTKEKKIIKRATGSMTPKELQKWIDSIP